MKSAGQVLMEEKERLRRSLLRHCKDKHRRDMLKYALDIVYPKDIEGPDRKCDLCKRKQIYTRSHSGGIWARSNDITNQWAVTIRVTTRWCINWVVDMEKDAEENRETYPEYCAEVLDGITAEDRERGYAVIIDFCDAVTTEAGIIPEMSLCKHCVKAFGYYLEREIITSDDEIKIWRDINYLADIARQYFEAWQLDRLGVLLRKAA